MSDHKFRSASVCCSRIRTDEVARICYCNCSKRAGLMLYAFISIFDVVNMKCCLDSMFCMTGLLLRICIFHVAGVISSAVVLHEYAVFQ
jgi:hypothetical protein